MSINVVMYGKCFREYIPCKVILTKDPRLLLMLYSQSLQLRNLQKITENSAYKKSVKQETLVFSFLSFCITKN
jgi:hypothetical protein